MYALSDFKASILFQVKPFCTPKLSFYFVPSKTILHAKFVGWIANSAGTYQILTAFSDFNKGTSTNHDLRWAVTSGSH